MKLLTILAVLAALFFGLKSDISRGPSCADCVAEVCGYRSEAAASISRDGSHHPLFAER
jgi:hypothetical protein